MAQDGEGDRVRELDDAGADAVDDDDDDNDDDDDDDDGGGGGIGGSGGWVGGADRLLEWESPMTSVMGSEHGVEPCSSAAWSPGDAAGDASSCVAPVC
jgi:hypothetical protein